MTKSQEESACQKNLPAGLVVVAGRTQGEGETAIEQKIQMSKSG
jgi:hypothetical protein